MFCFLTTGIPSLSLTCSYMVTNGMSAMKCTEDDLLMRYYWNIVITPCFSWIPISYYFLKTSDHFRNKILLPVHNLTYMSVCMFMFIKTVCCNTQESCHTQNCGKKLSCWLKFQVRLLKDLKIVGAYHQKCLLGFPSDCQLKIHWGIPAF